MRMVDLIKKKRDGGELNKEEINFIINGYTKGSIPDYQMAALLMAIYYKGMTQSESAELTMAMVKSGDVINLENIKGIKVDKHSTGGVGDTTTLVLAPLVAATGAPVAKMSGRGLGHTGGTIDKLESIPGFSVEIDNEKFSELVNTNKVAVVSQSGNLTPADKMLYALRDVTATVESIPLIASSIMSKKIASGADAIVLDVKTGDGAFMKDLVEAKKLAESMVQIGNNVGRKTIAIISDMSQPLGFAVGNSLEVKEAIATLKGEGPKDLEELSLILGSHMVYLAKQAENLKEAREKVEEVLQSGKALKKFKDFIKNQGGDPSVVDDPTRLPTATYTYEIKAKETGFVSKICASRIGTAAMLLGAGRATKESSIDLAVGLVIHKKIGDKVKKGDSLVTIHSNKENIEEIKRHIYESFTFSPEPVEKPPLIYEEIL